MSTIAQEINAITTAQGGTATGQTIVEAVNALADTLAGEDVTGGRTIADAISKLAPYIGSGGGGGDFDGVTANAVQWSSTAPQDSNYANLESGQVTNMWSAFGDQQGAFIVASGTLSMVRSGFCAQIPEYASHNTMPTAVYVAGTYQDEDGDTHYMNVQSLNFDASANTFTYNGETFHVRVIDSGQWYDGLWYEVPPIMAPSRLIFVYS